MQAPTGGSLRISITDPVSGALRATVGRRELQTIARRGCPVHPSFDCGCPVLDAPARVHRYEPTPAQRRFATARDRTCRHPGCDHRAGWADADHVLPHARGGQTDCANLCCLCRRHHRLKTLAPGWTYAMTPDGILTVRAPSGVTRTSRPPGLQLTGPRVPPDHPTGHHRNPTRPTTHPPSRPGRRCRDQPHEDWSPGPIRAVQRLAERERARTPSDRTP